MYNMVICFFKWKSKMAMELADIWFSTVENPLNSLGYGSNPGQMLN